MMLKFIFLVLLAVSQSWTLSRAAQALTQEEIVHELIGSPVYGMDGQEVGTVTDIALDEDEQFRTLFMKISRRLGLGERSVQLPSHAFIALRGAIVLELTAESFEELVEQGAEETVRNEPRRPPK